MKKLIVLIIISIFWITGCAGNDSYVRYLATTEHQINAERKPLLDLTLDKDARITNIKMYPAPRYIKIEQEKDHPIYALGGALVRVCGIVGSIFVAGEAIEGIVEASTGNVVYSNSYNNNAENAGTIGLETDYSDSKTDVVDTVVDTAE